MDEPITKTQPRSRARKGSNPLLYIAIGCAILLITFLFLHVKKESGIYTFKDIRAISSIFTGTSTSKPTPLLLSDPVEKQKTDLESQPKSQIDSLKPNLEDKNNKLDKVSAPSREILPIREPDGPEAVENQYLIEEINGFFNHLDQQAYYLNLGLNEPSKLYFSKLLQRLAKNPPVVFGEAQDLFTLLQNTAHLFRVLGKENIDIIKEILGLEKQSFEKLLKSFYSLTYQPQLLEDEFSLVISPKVLTDYAAFFLNTMGGRLYLFRRDSNSRMLVSFYALLIIDRANIEGNGGHGINIKPAIIFLIDEMKNGGNGLQFKDDYLDKLYDLQEKYN